MKTVERARQMLRRALEERATPREIALAVALGAFISTSPLVGLHMVVAVPAATLLRLNRLLTVLGTNLSIGPIVAVLALSEVYLGSKLLGRPLPSLSLDNALETAKNAIGAWWLGFAVVGPAVALVVGVVTYALALWRDSKTPPEQPSEQPPEAPPAPPGGG